MTLLVPVALASVIILAYLIHRRNVRRFRDEESLAIRRIIAARKDD
jgi:hypothetical protein